MLANIATRHLGFVFSLAATTFVATTVFGILSAVSSPVNSGTVSFVNIDKSPIDLIVTDNVTKDDYKFQLKVGEETKSFKVSGDVKNGFNSDFTWKATGQDANKKSIARCGTEKRSVNHGSYGRLD